MRIAAQLMVVAFAAALAVSLGSCAQTRDNMRPDMDTVRGDENGLQSRDLREMTDKVAPDLLRIPEIANNPTKVVIVVKPIENHLVSDPTEDLSIYVARLANLLGSRAGDKIAFVEEQSKLRQVQGEELGNPDPMEDASRGGGAPDARLKPQYALTGKFFEKNNGRTSYYLCEFNLVDIRTGRIVWNPPAYEVDTLNLK